MTARLSQKNRWEISPKLDILTYKESIEVMPINLVHFANLSQQDVTPHQRYNRHLQQQKRQYRRDGRVNQKNWPKKENRWKHSTANHTKYRRRIPRNCQARNVDILKRFETDITVRTTSQKVYAITCNVCGRMCPLCRTYYCNPSIQINPTHVPNSYGNRSQSGLKGLSRKALPVRNQ